MLHARRSEVLYPLPQNPRELLRVTDAFIVVFETFSFPLKSKGVVLWCPYWGLFVDLSLPSHGRHISSIPSGIPAHRPL